MIMTVAIATNSPLPVVWDMTLGQIQRYADSAKSVLPLLNPFAEAPKKADAPKSTVKQAKTVFAALGFPIKKADSQ